MGTTKNSVADMDIGLQTLVMAIREELMSYFKGTCVTKLAHTKNVKVRSMPSFENSYSYERRRSENERARMVYIKDVPILTVKYAPDRVIFHTHVLNRSPQLRKIRDSLEDFMDRFLMGVEKEYNDANSF